MFSEEMICSLNDLELEVYKYVVRNADKVCYMRIREFADAAHVSTSTILRFCKKAGCDGYAEFKIRLRQHLEQAKQPPVKDDVSEVIDFLKKTCSAEFEQKLDMLTRVIFQARHIFFVGSGMSGIVAKYGARYFSSMGKFCLYIDEPHYPTESRFVENSLVIVFSVSGESRDTIGHVMRFKEQNCQIICCSALLTTTMPAMKEVVAALNKSPRRKDFKIMVGGAPITQEFCDEIGADVYTPDAASAGQAAKKLAMERSAS